ncbi:MAG: SEC-C domain-containing protein [Candidatus Eremiobacteraeota bacterium]|nr:SEC-C domain-containing protein [Candidatus Eremiobacteraeota bacterium]
MSKRVKVGRNEPCPCRSGKKYNVCCYDRGFNYIQNEKGGIVREIPPDERRFSPPVRGLQGKVWARTGSGRQDLLDEPVPARVPNGAFCPRASG